MKLTLTTEPDDDIVRVARAIVMLALVGERVVDCQFNEITLTASPKTTADEVVRDYFTRAKMDAYKG
jgi:hypothetical protein